MDNASGLMQSASIRPMPSKRANNSNVWPKFTQKLRVVVWLGIPDNGSDWVLDHMLELTKAFQVAPVRVIPEHYPQYGIPKLKRSTWSASRDVLASRWSNRLWTLQESVLAQRIVTSCGNKRIEWSDLVAFMKASTHSRTIRLFHGAEHGNVEVFENKRIGMDQARDFQRINSTTVFILLLQLSANKR